VPGGRLEPSGAGRLRPAGGRVDVTTSARAGVRICALAAALAGLGLVTGDGQAYWLCIPVALLAAGWCGTPAATALATAVVLAGAGAPALAGAVRPPAVWAALLAPAGSVAIVEWRAARLRCEREDLRDVALTDPLTRIANRRALQDRARHEVSRHLRSGRPFAVLMLDLDGFKGVNDRFGHGAGDDLLRDVAAALARAMRAQDLVARIGGDEFCVLAPETSEAGAARLADRVRAAVHGVTAGAVAVRGSVGAAVFPEDAIDPAELIRIADIRLLAAKRELYRDRSARRAA
jgi:diguanylate cyclase (GGDEF)-like protein